MADAHLHEAVLEERLAALEAARAWSPRVISRLEARIRAAEDLALFRVNALAYATETSMDEREAIDLFLHATNAGLFEMEWNIVCASCANTARSFRALERLDPHFACEVCQMTAEVSLDDYIQVGFTVAPAVRAISFHDPTGLGASDLIFRWYLSRDARATWAPKPFPALLEDWTRYLDYLEPGESTELELDLDSQGIAIRDPLHRAAALYFIQGERSREEETRIELVLGETGFVDGERTLEPFVYRFEDRDDISFDYPAMAVIGPGPTRIGVTNALAERAVIWANEYPSVPSRFLAVEFEPVLTARRVLSTQTFRTLFRSQTLATSEALAVKDLTFLFSDLQDSTRMYDDIGDATAYDLVRRHFDALEEVIREHDGAIVKTIGDAIMATFVETADGVRAAIAMAERMDEFEASASARLVLKLGLHRGHAIAVTSNDRVDYFGQTINIAARIQGLAGPRELCLSEDVCAADGVEALLEGRPVALETGVLKGVADEVAIRRVTLEG